MSWKKDREARDREEEEYIRARYPRSCRSPLLCPLCNQQHQFAACPFRYYEEPERPTPEWQEPERPTPEWEEPERPTPEWEEPERPTPESFALLNEKSQVALCQAEKMCTIFIGTKSVICAGYRAHA
ncbi:UNVERIFIED_CONTAM: hypothetical protein FKN15_072830 [Acipenser sinensis]